MPLDLFVSKAPSFEALASASPAVTLASLPPPPGATRRPDGSYWLSHPGGGPWLVASDRGPNVVLSTSYSAPRFLRNFADMFDLALQLGGALDARVFDEVQGIEVTRASVDALLAPNGPYVTQQAQTFRDVRDRMEREGQAPLELPVGPFDLVSEYFVFYVTRERPITLAEVEAALRARLPRLATQRSAGVEALAITPADERGFFARTFGAKTLPSTKVLVRPDRVQVCASWQRPFDEIARTTIDVAEAIEAETGGTLDFLHRRCDAATRKELRAREAGLGVELHAWTQTLG